MENFFLRLPLQRLTGHDEPWHSLVIHLLPAMEDRALAEGSRMRKHYYNRSLGNADKFRIG